DSSLFLSLLPHPPGSRKIFRFTSQWRLPIHGTQGPQGVHRHAFELVSLRRLCARGADGLPFPELMSRIRLEDDPTFWDEVIEWTAFTVLLLTVATGVRMGASAYL